MATSTLLCLVLLHVVGVLGFSVTLKLEKSFPTNHGVELKRHAERDGLRRRRILHKYSDPNVVVGFGVLGTYDPFDVGKRLVVGRLQTLPTSSTLQIPITIYDPASSSTSSPILCSDERCSPKSNSCFDNQYTYDLHYGDGSGTSGYYVSELMHFKIVVGETYVLNTSASVLFG
ncbi:aspartic proteinase nepenthesin-2-like [Lactuca sativa]|uniref:Xylanase inhibitor N-terminal domain-containing protein n=1 Tax=Lactuca saligna TaxID=75948 RepID=A0AA35VA33_LACSI|nr:aspartic proteinase nepenthesin-2-like [Lactuca sativa]CAI9269721.1 unnamed protein product [Lactuca saligna]